MQYQDSTKLHVVRFVYVIYVCSCKMGTILSRPHYVSTLTYPDVYYGSWCASPRNCSALVSCVEAEIIKVRESRTRRAFLEYLEEAPKIEVVDVGDPEKCGELREYFDYAKDYVDDLRICREVKDLQVRHRS